MNSWPCAPWPIRSHLPRGYWLWSRRKYQLVPGAGHPERKLLRGTGVLCCNQRSCSALNTASVSIFHMETR